MDAFISPTSTHFSRLTDCVSRLLHCLGCPYQLRAFVDALIGICDGDAMSWIEISDSQLGWRVRTDQAAASRSAHDAIRCISESEQIVKGYRPKKRLTDEAITKSVQRFRKQYVTWQKAIGIDLIEIDPGGKKKDRYYATRYRFPIVSYLEEILDLAESEVDYPLAPDEAFERVMRRQLLTERLRVDNATPRKDRFNRSKPSIDSEVKRAMTALGKAFNMCLTTREAFPERVMYRMLERLEDLQIEWEKWTGNEPVAAGDKKRAVNK